MKLPSRLALLLAAAIAPSISYPVSGHALPVRSASGGATLVTFAGYWWGHARGLSITRSGRGRESIYSSCCDPVISLVFQVSRPRGTTKLATAIATVVSVRVQDRSFFSKARPAPHVGERRTIQLRGGVIIERLTGAYYCGPHISRCGA